tara:strand:+ start:1198 stop:1800 length:603 start_codon:yes stop_codon:yes gene_type:complete
MTDELNKIKFDFDHAQTTTQQSLEVEDADASGQEYDEESPTQHKFVRFRGDSWGDLIKVHGVKLPGPDGEDIKYVVQIKDNNEFLKVNRMCDFKIKEYVIAPYVSDSGSERIWFANYKWSGKAAKKGMSVKLAIEIGQQEWVKVNWEGKRGFVTRKPGTELEKEPKFSTLDNAQLIELVFDDRIITDSKHEAVIRNWNGS